MRWRSFTAELIELCDTLGVEMVVTLGALLADAPHTRPGAGHGPVVGPGLATR
jgi:hypothetical protein